MACRGSAVRTRLAPLDILLVIEISLINYHNEKIGFDKLKEC